MSQVDIDKELVNRVLAQEEQAFRQFFDNYFPRLFRFVLARINGDEQAAADIVQAALIKAMRKLETWRGEAALFTWLCTICRRELSDYCRAAAVRETHEVLTEDRPDLMAIVHSLAATEDDSPESSYRRVELGRLIQVTLDQLPVRYGDALEWKYIYGFSAKDIAGKLDLSVDATNSMLARAKRAFREAYGALAEDAVRYAGEES